MEQIDEIEEETLSPLLKLWLDETWITLLWIHSHLNPPLEGGETVRIHIWKERFPTVQPYPALSQQSFLSYELPELG